MYRLVFLSGRHAGKRLLVRQALTIVGRDPDCHLVLTDSPAIAPRHAEFKETSAGVFLTALTPDAPILHNGAPLTTTLRLTHNDQLDLGGLLIQFQTIIAPHARFKSSPGLIQPATLLLAIVILIVEALMLGFMFDWRTRLIRPDTEARDLAWAEEYRAQVKAEKEAKEKSGTAPANSVIVLPGTTDTAPPHVAATNEPAATDPRPPEPPSSIAAAVLDDADFAPATTNTPLANLPPVSAADPAIETAQRILAEADAAAQFADFAKAFRLLNQLHQTTPGFLPAYAQHARLLETRGDLEGAQYRWGQLLTLAPANSPFRRQASTERQRLAQLQEQQTRILQHPLATDLASLPRIVYFTPPELQKLLPTADVAEHRLLRTTLQLAPNAHLFKNAQIQVFVTFYDKDQSGHIAPSIALVTTDPAAPGAAFADTRSVPYTASYIVTHDQRAQALRATGQPTAFYGYTLHVFAGAILQDAIAKPKLLLDRGIQFAPPDTPTR